MVLIADREWCADFETFKSRFACVLADLDAGIRETRPFAARGSPPVAADVGASRRSAIRVTIITMPFVARCASGFLRCLDCDAQFCQQLGIAEIIHHARASASFRAMKAMPSAMHLSHTSGDVNRKTTALLELQGAKRKAARLLIGEINALARAYRGDLLKVPSFIDFTRIE